MNTNGQKEQSQEDLQPTAVTAASPFIKKTEAYAKECEELIKEQKGKRAMFLVVIEEGEDTTATVTSIMGRGDMLVYGITSAMMKPSNKDMADILRYSIENVDERFSSEEALSALTGQAEQVNTGEEEEQ